MMKGFLSKIWFPAAVVSTAAALTLGSAKGPAGEEYFAGAPLPVIVQIQGENPVDTRDTVIYDPTAYRRGWSEQEILELRMNDSLLSAYADSSSLDLELDTIDSSMLRPAALDSLIAPDSLRQIDTFRYRYYAALRDSLCHVWVRDSLKTAGDSLDWPRLDSLYRVDSIYFAKLRFEEWYNSLSEKERKEYDKKVRKELKQAEKDSLELIRDSLKFIRDSIFEATPRILESFAIPDSMQYKRIISWTHEREFHKMHLDIPDSSYNYHFNDYPFMKKDVNATWLGVAGSPVQTYDYFKRNSEGVFFYDPNGSWSYSAETLPFYNTKTPHTELGYWGTLLAGNKKESDNIRIFTTQNITPALNFALEFNRFGGGGILKNETTANKTLVANVNYLGKRYLLHTAIINNNVQRSENGGILDNYWIRDTVVDAREIGVALQASSSVRKRTIILDQQYRIPFEFINTIKAKKAAKDSLALSNSLEAPEIVPVDENGDIAQETPDSTKAKNPEDITTAFIGHSTEYSVYSRYYKDEIDDLIGREYYGNVFNYNPVTATDSMRTMRLDNKVFIRLQPWANEAIVSKLDVGLGDRYMTYYTPDPTFTSYGGKAKWNSIYAYAGVEGQYKKYLNWDAKGNYVFAGYQRNDFGISANATVSLYPFRKNKKSPLRIGAHFETTLQEPEFYHQHLYTNHYKWDNSFSKISNTKIQGTISIPEWKLEGSVGYSLLAGQVYFDTLSIVKQNAEAMSVLTASLRKDFVIANFLHLDNKILFQTSSNPEVLPLPTLAINLKYFIEFDVKKDAMRMQIGANVLYNTPWNSPGWNPALGVFYNQNENKYTNGPYIDAFINMQWKRTCLFIKCENVGQGWPLKERDYFSADRFIRTQRVLKLGVFWPFYTLPAKHVGKAAIEAAAGKGAPSTNGSKTSGNSPSGSAGKRSPVGGGIKTR